MHSRPSRDRRRKAYLPSVQALDAPDDALLREELRCLAARQQAAVVRALADQLALVSPGQASGNLREQLAEQLARLGCRILEAAATISERTVPAPASGVLPVSSGDVSAAS